MVKMLMVVALSGCGPQFAGKWVGNLDETGSCSDGSGVPSTSYPVSWVISEKEDQLTIVTTGNCGSFRATQRGSMATVERKDCPPQTSPTSGITGQQTVRFGTLTLSESLMSVSLSSTYHLSDAASSGLCDTVAVGTVVRDTK